MVHGKKRNTKTTGSMAKLKLFNSYEKAQAEACCESQITEKNGVFYVATGDDSGNNCCASEQEEVHKEEKASKTTKELKLKDKKTK